MSAINDQWLALFKQKNIELNCINKYLPLQITSEEINKTKNILGAKAKDARLLVKIDNREALPEIFLENGLFLLPVKNGEFVLLKGEGFSNIENLSSKVNEFESKLDFELLSSRIGDSEMQHLDYSFNTGLLQSHYNVKSLYQTIRGRKYTPAFSFLFHNNSINVEGVQIEVDGGYEAENTIALIEAKNTKINNFVIRQLYYPYRTWKYHVPSKEIKASFFSHNNGIYTIHDFSFLDINDYNQITQVKTTHYRIVSPKRINDFKLPFSPSGVNIIPQADDLNKVLELVIKVSKGCTDSQSMAEEMRFERRQSSYYREAAEALGLVYMENNQYFLTEAGKTFISKKTEDKNTFLAKQLLNIPIFFRIFSSLIENKKPIPKQKIIDLIMENSHLNETTAKRRSSTILSWLGWFSNQIGKIQVIENAVSIK